MVRIKTVKKPSRSNKPPDDDGGFDPPSTTPPQSGLVPVPGTPFYATPNEPASPFDCDRYAESLYCGGNPFTQTPVGLEPSIVIDECNLGIQVTPTLGFVILPSLQIVYRRNTEACRPKPPPTPIPDTVPPDFVFPDPPIDPNTIFAAVMYASKVVGRTEFNEFNYGPRFGSERSCLAGTHTIYRAITVNEFEFPYIDPSIEIDPVIKRTYARLKLTLKTSVSGSEVSNCHNESHFKDCDSTETIEIVTSTGEIITHFSIPGSIDTLAAGTLIIGNYDLIKRVYVNGSGLSGAGETSTYVPNWKNKSTVDARKNYTKYDTLEFNILIKSNTPPPPKEPPPPKPPKRCDCTMTCCPSTTQNDQLLRSLIQKVDKLSKIVGVDDYPVSLPTSLISKDEGFLGNLIPNFNEDVPSLTRFLAWYVARFDEIMGQWEIPVEVKDSDPSKPGDQPLGVKLPNIAEAIAEIFTLAFQTNLNSETLLNFAVRTAAETVTDKQQNFITYKLLQSMTEWAGYKQKDIKLKMPILFSLGKKRYDEILNESEIDVPCVDFDEKFGLEADLMRFREAAGILQAVYKKKVDPSGDVKAQILKHLLDAFAAVNKVNGEDDDADFKKFLTDVENGFINTPGANNTTEPYGRPYNQRPKIRDLTDDKPPTTP